MYPSSERERRVDHRELENLVTAIFEKCGMDEPDAALLAGLLVKADLRGCHSHGVIRVPDYVFKLRQGGVDPRGRPEVVVDNKAALVVDANNSMGQISCYFAMQQAIDRAKDLGLAMACIQGSNHCGAMADYSLLACEHQMIGISGTNALPTMAPYGGIDKILGINPLSIAFPTGDKYPVVLDAAFSASSHGKIRVYHQKNQPIPNHWAFNRQGEVTTDAAEAIEGLLQPIGGYKGTGLALMVGLLSTMLSQASYGTQLGNMIDGPRPGKDGHFCLAINISHFIDFEQFKGNIKQVTAEIINSRRMPGVDRIYLPGGLEAELQEHYSSQGIPLNEVTLNDINQVARQLGLNNIWF